MYFHNPRRSMTNSSIDHQALLKTTHIAILTASGSCWNDSLSIFSPFFKWPCRPFGKTLIVKAHFKSSILLGNQNEDWRSCTAGVRISEAFAKKMFPGQDPLGKTFQTDRNGPKIQIVGATGTG